MGATTGELKAAIPGVTLDHWSGWARLSRNPQGELVLTFTLPVRNEHGISGYDATFDPAPIFPEQPKYVEQVREAQARKSPDMNALYRQAQTWEVSQDGA